MELPKYRSSFTSQPFAFEASGLFSDANKGGALNGELFYANDSEQFYIALRSPSGNNGFDETGKANIYQIGGKNIAYQTGNQNISGNKNFIGVNTFYDLNSNFAGRFSGGSNLPGLYVNRLYEQNWAGNVVSTTNYINLTSSNAGIFTSGIYRVIDWTQGKLGNLNGPPPTNTTLDWFDGKLFKDPFPSPVLTLNWFDLQLTGGNWSATYPTENSHIATREYVNNPEKNINYFSGSGQYAEKGVNVFTGNYEVTGFLPPASNGRFEYFVKNLGVENYTILTSGIETIDLSISEILVPTGESYTFLSDGISNYIII